MASIEDYSRAAQFAQYLQYKSLFEGYAPSDVGVALRRFPVEGVESRAHLPGGALYDWGRGRQGDIELARLDRPRNKCGADSRVGDFGQMQRPLP